MTIGSSWGEGSFADASWQVGAWAVSSLITWIDGVVTILPGGNVTASDLLIIYVNNDNVIELQIKDSILATDLSGATVTCKLHDEAGTEIDSQTMTYIELVSSYYKFRSSLADTLALVADKLYTVVIDADGGEGKKGYWEYQAFSKSRT